MEVIDLGIKCPDDSDTHLSFPSSSPILLSLGLLFLTVHAVMINFKAGFRLLSSWPLTSPANWDVARQFTFAYFLASSLFTLPSEPHSTVASVGEVPSSGFRHKWRDVNSSCSLPMKQSTGSSTSNRKGPSKNSLLPGIGETCRLLLGTVWVCQPTPEFLCNVVLKQCKFTIQDRMSSASASNRLSRVKRCTYKSKFIST